MKLENLRSDTPAVYTIRVAGVLDKNWSGYFGGLTIKTKKIGSEGQTSITTLSGRMADQATLLGLLNALYDYHYPLLSLERKETT
jgi:hypothetical protein